MHRGYLALWRKVDDHPFYKEPRVFSKYEAWIDILKEAQHTEQPKQVVLGMTILTCGYGECLKSNVTWAKKWNWSEAKVRRFFKLLVKMGQIETNPEGKTTRILVVNYSDYDPKRRKNGDTVTGEQRASDEGATTDNNDKNYNNYNNTPSCHTSWKSDFQIYLEQCNRSFNELIVDLDWIHKHERFNPGVDILLTMEKAKNNYWATDEAWKKKKRQKIESINWKMIWQNALSDKINRVYKEAVQRHAKTKASYNFPVCPHCGINGTDVIAGERCPNPSCDKIIPRKGDKDEQ